LWIGDKQYANHSKGNEMSEDKRTANETQNLDFQTHLESVLERTRQTLGEKAGQYVAGNDRLWNFKQIAHLNRTTAQQALFGLVSKHIVALADFCRKENMTDVSLEQWQEKTGDIICYMALLQFMALEEHNEKENGNE